MKFLNRDRRQMFEESDDTDPLFGVVNLFDAAMVFAVALLVSAVTFMRMNEMFTNTDVTIVKNPGKADMEIIKKEGKKIARYRASSAASEGGKGRRIGIAYELENGEIIYIPEEALTASPD
jgi:hypothetical protein